MSGSLGSVVAELQALRREVADLQARVLALESAGGPSEAVPFASPVTVNYSFASGAQQQYPALPPFPFGSPGERLSGTEFSSPASNTTAGSVQYSEVQRREAAVRVGQFLRRALAGEVRGDSGRSSLRLPSRCYILCQDITGQRFNPVRIFSSWSSIKPHVKVGSDCGDSIFVGLPSLWEAEVAIREAGLQVPSHGGSGSLGGGGGAAQ